MYLTDFGITKQLGGDVDGHRPDGRHARLPGAGADPRRAGRRPHGRLRARLRALRVPGRRAAVSPRTEAETLWAHMQEQPPPLKGHAALDPVLRKALAKDREDRYETCAELIEAARGGARPGRRTASGRAAAPAPARRRPGRCSSPAGCCCSPRRWRRPYRRSAAARRRAPPSATGSPRSKAPTRSSPRSSRPARLRATSRSARAAYGC